MKSKILLCLIGTLWMFSLTAKADVTEKNLGRVIAVERTFQVSPIKALVNLKQNEKTKLWASHVVEVKEPEIVVGVSASRMDHYTASNGVTVFYAAKPDGYDVLLSWSKTDDIPEAVARDAVEESWKALDLGHRPFVLTVSKVETAKN